jgi:chemotaxis protein MotB
MAAKTDRKGAGGAGVVIRKEEVTEGGHHGGAWKVAYADFVTAMMAFFLLMWLLNATTEDQRKGLADYFSPNNLLSHASSGTGQPFGGHTAFDDGALVSDRGAVQVTLGKRPVAHTEDDGEAEIIADPHGLRTSEAAGREISQNDDPDAQAGNTTTAKHEAAKQAAGSGSADTPQMPIPGDAHPPTQAEIQAEKAREEKAAFEKAAQQIRQAVQQDPALSGLAKQLAIDMTPEGLRIQIMDEVKAPMFDTGSSTPNERARLLLQKVVPVLLRLQQSISIAGYTDATPFPGPGRTNWELSAERANATRRLLTEAGLPGARISSVTGRADRDPLLPADPFAAANRRIAIVVLREAGNRTATPAP